MITDCEPLKRKIQIFFILVNIISFLIMTIYINKNKEKYNEYTNLSKFISNFYILMIFLIMLFDSISPNIVCKIFSENINIFINSKGKIMIILLIGIMYWTSNNFPHLLFGIVNFISFFVLILSEFIFDCKILKNVNQGKIINKEESNTNEHNISNNNNMFKNYISSKHNSKLNKDVKNASNVPFFEKVQANDNYFDQIRKTNLKSENNNK